MCQPYIESATILFDKISVVNLCNHCLIRKDIQNFYQKHKVGKRC